MDFYQEYIAKSRYSRFLEKKDAERIGLKQFDRYMDFMKNHLETKIELHDTYADRLRAA